MSGAGGTQESGAGENTITMAVVPTDDTQQPLDTVNVDVSACRGEGVSELSPFDQGCMRVTATRRLPTARRPPFLAQPSPANRVCGELPLTSAASMTQACPQTGARPSRAGEYRYFSGFRSVFSDDPTCSKSSSEFFPVFVPAGGRSRPFYVCAGLESAQAELSATLPRRWFSRRKQLSRGQGLEGREYQAVRGKRPLVVGCEL